VCKYCGEDFAKSIKECPHCGKKVQSGKLLLAIIGAGCLALAGAFAIPIQKSQPDDMKIVLTASADRVNPAELAALFNDSKIRTSPEAQRRAREIKGKIVQWDLEVFAVTNSAECYQVLTKSDTSVPGTLTTVYPQDSQQQSYLDGIKPGSVIRIKGKIAGIQNGRVKINPALIL
jgi:hypothetical protein